VVALLLAADRGGWHCFGNSQCGAGLRRWTTLAATATGATWLATDRGGLFQHSGTARCGTTLEDNTSDKLVCWFNGGGFIPVEATREVDLRWWFLLFDGDLGGWGIPTHYFDGNL
jgi:hypothetical protein